MADEEKDTESTKAGSRRSRSETRKFRGRRQRRLSEKQGSSGLTTPVMPGNVDKEVRKGRGEPVSVTYKSAKRSERGLSGSQGSQRRLRLRGPVKDKKNQESERDAGLRQDVGGRLKGGSMRLSLKRQAEVLRSSFITIGLVLVVVLIIVIANSRMIPLPHKNYTVAPAAIPARDTIKVCPAPPRLLDTATGIDPRFSPVSRDVKTQVRAFTASRVAGLIPEVTLKERGGNSLIQNGKAQAEAQEPYFVLQADRKTAAGSEIKAKSSGGRQVEVASAYSYVADDGDIQGLATVGCQTPRNEQWISGIATSLGYTSILTVTNPGQGSATINITLYDEQGAINSTAAQLVVAAGSERSVMLAALGRSKERLTAKISSATGAVTATVAQNKMRGLSPGGVEILTPGEGPSSRQVIPAYRQENPQRIKELSSQFGYQDAVPALQVTAPDEDARIRVRFYNEQGEYQADEQEFDVPARTVRDISLADLPAGMYTLKVTSTNSNIVAAARMISGERGQSMDFAWAHATNTVAEHHIFAVSAFGATTVSVFAPDSRSKLQLTPITADGLTKEEKTLEVVGNKSIVLKPEDYGKDVVGFMIGAVDGAVFAGQAVTASSKNQISWLEVPRPAEEQSGVPVALRY